MGRTRSAKFFRRKAQQLNGDRVCCSWFPETLICDCQISFTNFDLRYWWQIKRPTRNGKSFLRRKSNIPLIVWFIRGELQCLLSAFFTDGLEVTLFFPVANSHWSSAFQWIENLFTLFFQTEGIFPLCHQLIFKICRCLNLPPFEIIQCFFFSDSFECKGEKEQEVFNSRKCRCLSWNHIANT